MIWGLAPGIANADEGWVIERFDVDVVLAPDATFTVIERIEVDFGGLQRRGIFRRIPYRHRYDDERDRVIVIDRWNVRTSPGAPDDLHLERSDGDVVARIGDPGTYISGRHTYHLSYRVHGAFNSFDEHEELFWNVTGGQWPVPIEAASVTVVGLPVQRAICFVGEYGSTRTCERIEGAEGSRMITARATGLTPGQGMTIVVAHPPGAVQVPPPILEYRWDLRRAMVGHAAAIPLAVAIAGLVLFGLGRLFTREARDRVTRGGRTVDGRVDEAGAPRAIFEPRAVPVRFRPPDDLRPGQLGVITDERVDPVDISATIVDLAVRGYLRVEEESNGLLWWSKSDWHLHRTDGSGSEAAGASEADTADPATAEADDLRTYERTLLDALFSTGSPVAMSELSGSFHEDYSRVQGMLYDDAVSRGWFNRSPRATRGLWLGAGIAMTLAAVAVLGALLAFTTVGLAGVPLVLGAVAVTWGHRWMPHRTVKGSRLLDETLGFREFVATAEAGLARFAEEEGIFTRYLPYAVVFGVTDKWAQAFSRLGIDVSADVGRFYIGANGMAPDLTRLSSGLSDMARAGSGLASTPASSGGSGFSGGGSGGGFGGGGGGSW